MTVINILFPVYNEHLRLEKGIRRTVDYMDVHFPHEYVLTIVDNASVDDTEKIARQLCNIFPQLYYIRIQEKGVGAAFRAGVRENTAPIVGYMDIDLSTDINHIQEVIEVFNADPSVDMINGSRWNKKSDTRGRKWYRSITSKGLTFLLKAALGMKATDAICGFKFYRKECAESLVHEAGASEDGWFYIIELLIRAERGGRNIHELPVRWQDDHNSTVKVVPLIRNYCGQIHRLRKLFKEERTRKS